MARIDHAELNADAPPPDQADAPGASAWRVSGRSQMVARHWQGGSVIYDSATGGTHLLTPLAWAAWTWLASREEAFIGSDVVPADLREELPYLEQLGLVQRFGDPDNGLGGHGA